MQWEETGGGFWYELTQPLFPTYRIAATPIFPIHGHTGWPGHKVKDQHVFGWMVNCTWAFSQWLGLFHIFKICTMHFPIALVGHVWNRPGLLLWRTSWLYLKKLVGISEAVMIMWKKGIRRENSMWQFGEWVCVWGQGAGQWQAPSSFTASFTGVDVILLDH